MDKWRCAARFFKTRALAARACELGRITSNGQPAKSARPVRVGDLLQVKNDSGEFQVELCFERRAGSSSGGADLVREMEASRGLLCNWQRRLRRCRALKLYPREDHRNAIAGNSIGFGGERK